MLHNPYKIVKMFEEEVAHYTGAPYAVSVDSCTNALFLCLKYLESKFIGGEVNYYDEEMPHVRIPKRTYLSVPMAAIHAGFHPILVDEDWKGIYQLKPYPVFDSAKRFTSGMYTPGLYMCLSFHIKKHLKIGKGGMILTDNADAVEWFQKARYEGRSQKFYKEDNIDSLGWNMYMTPQEAAHGLALMQNFPEHNEDLPEGDGYKDLTEMEIFKKYAR